MFQRKLFNRQEISEQYHMVRHSWIALSYRLPQLIRMVHQCRYAPLALDTGTPLGLVTPDTIGMAMQQGLATFYWALGDRITKELLAIGQLSMIVSLMGIRHALTHTDIEEDEIDLQVVLLLTVLRGISRHQTFEDPALFILKLLDELELDPEFHNKLLHTAISVELTYREDTFRDANRLTAVY
jgi:hypothetical protein